MVHRLENPAHGPRQVINGPLSSSEVEAFYRDGFLIRRNAIEAEVLSEIAHSLTRLRVMAAHVRNTRMYRGTQFVVEPYEDSGGNELIRIHRVVWCGAAEKTLLEHGAHPMLLAMAAQLLDSREMDQLINQVHFKFPGDGVSFPWHQDSRHRRYGTEMWEDVNGRGSFVQTLMAIDPMTLDNGPIVVIPGSGREGHIECNPLSNELPDGVVDESRAVALEMQAGDVLLMDPYLIHSSEPNQGNHARRVFINGFSCPGANHRDYPGRGSGRRLTALV